VAFLPKPPKTLNIWSSKKFFIPRIAPQSDHNSCRCLCPLNGLQFANPSIVALAAYKVYGHRIVVADKDTDRSVMWGSKKEAVDKYLAEVDADMIINNVLDEVRAPL